MSLIEFILSCPIPFPIRYQMSIADKKRFPLYLCNKRALFVHEAACIQQSVLYLPGISKRGKLNLFKRMAGEDNQSSLWSWQCAFIGNIGIRGEVLFYQVETVIR